MCLIALPIIALFHLPLDPQLATASATAAASTAAPLPAAAAMARTSGRATFTFSRCTVQEAVIQSLHQLSRGGGKAREEEERTRESFFFFLRQATLRPAFPSFYLYKARSRSVGRSVTRSPLCLLFFPSEKEQTSFALLRDSLPPLSFSRSSLTILSRCLSPLFGLFYLSWSCATEAADDANGEEEGESF